MGSASSAVRSSVDLSGDEIYNVTSPGSGTNWMLMAAIGGAALLVVLFFMLKRRQ